MQDCTAAFTWRILMKGYFMDKLKKSQCNEKLTPNLKAQAFWFAVYEDAILNKTLERAENVTQLDKTAII